MTTEAYIISGMGAVIILLLTGGFVIISTKLAEMTTSINKVNDFIMDLVVDVARIDAHQKERLMREQRGLGKILEGSV